MLFVSHAFEDQSTVVNPLVEGLKAGGVAVWYSREHLRQRNAYLFEVFNQAINECDAALVVLTPAYMATAYAQRELSALHNQHVYQHKPLYIYASGVSVREIQARYPLIADLFIHAASPSEIFFEAGARLAALMTGEEKPRQRVGLVAAPQRRISWVLMVSLLLGLGSGVGIWAAYDAGVFWQHTPAEPSRIEKAVAQPTAVSVLPTATPKVSVPKAPAPVTANPSGIRQFLSHADAYRVYLGNGRFASILLVTELKGGGFLLRYDPPSGLDVDATFQCKGNVCEGTYDGWATDGRIQELVFRPDGAALGNWHTVVKWGGDIVTDTFAIVAMPR